MKKLQKIVVLGLRRLLRSCLNEVCWNHEPRKAPRGSNCKFSVSVHVLLLIDPNCVSIKVAGSGAGRQFKTCNVS